MEVTLNMSLMDIIKFLNFVFIFTDNEIKHLQAQIEYMNDNSEMNSFYCKDENGIIYNYQFETFKHGCYKVIKENKEYKLSISK